MCSLGSLELQSDNSFSSRKKTSEKGQPALVRELISNLFQLKVVVSPISPNEMQWGEKTHLVWSNKERGEVIFSFDFQAKIANLSPRPRKRESQMSSQLTSICFLLAALFDQVLQCTVHLQDEFLISTHEFSSFAVENSIACKSQLQFEPRDRVHFAIRRWQFRTTLLSPRLVIRERWRTYQVDLSSVGDRRVVQQR